MVLIPIYHLFFGFPHLLEDLLPEAFPELPPENPPHPPGSDGDDSACAFLRIQYHKCT